MLPASEKFSVKGVFGNPVYRFLIIFLTLFTILSRFNWAFEGIITPRNYYSPFLDEHLNYMRWLTNILVGASKLILEVLGYKAFVWENWLRVAGVGGVIIDYPCLGFQIMSFFTAFVIAYPKSRKSRLRFLIGGLIAFQLLNIARLILLSLFWDGSFVGTSNHHDIFNYTIYFLLIVAIFSWISLGGRKQQVDFNSRSIADKSDT